MSDTNGGEGQATVSESPGSGEYAEGKAPGRRSGRTRSASAGSSAPVQLAASMCTGL
jgi:hypothetical protein